MSKTDLDSPLLRESQVSDRTQIRALECVEWGWDVQLGTAGSRRAGLQELYEQQGLHQCPLCNLRTFPAFSGLCLAMHQPPGAPDWPGASPPGWGHSALSFPVSSAGGGASLGSQEIGEVILGRAETSVRPATPSPADPASPPNTHSTPPTRQILIELLK